MKNYIDIKNLGQLKKSDYKTKTIKEELRENLIYFLKNKINPFKGIVGYDNTVIPDLEHAILSKHNILLLGLRGQAKTRIARMIVNLLDDFIPIISGSELNDDPFNPISIYAKEIISSEGDNTEIQWISKEERYSEKLATPDVTIADLIGDVDPIKAANLKLPYSDPHVLHFGIIPRANRSIFAINELPDLQARIQVALFNLLQEKDIQIRGFKVRLPLDVQFIFTANPEDYTNRGSIVTPLKDRIESQILTHYPKTINDSKNITKQEAKLSEFQKNNIKCNELINDIINQIAFEARESEYIDYKSGVSARLTISSYENIFSSAERRLILNEEHTTSIRISDLYNIIPAITGKIELVYEGEQEGPAKVANILIGKAIRRMFLNYFPNPDTIKKRGEVNPYKEIVLWFSKGNSIEILKLMNYKNFCDELLKVSGLEELVRKNIVVSNSNDLFLFMEFALFGLAEFSILSKHFIEKGTQFKDMFSSMFNSEQVEDDEPKL